MHGGKKDVFSHVFMGGAWIPDPGPGNVTVDSAKNYVWDSAASLWVPQPVDLQVSVVDGQESYAYNYVWDSAASLWIPQPAQSNTVQSNTYNYVWDSATSLWVKQTQSSSVAAGETNVKTVYGDILSLTTVSGGQQYNSAAFSCVDYQHAVVFIDFAPLSTSTPAVGTELKIEGSHKTGTADGWRTLVVFRTGTAAAASTTTPGDTPAATNYFAKNPAPSYTTTDRIFFQNQVDLTKSEWAEVVNVIGPDGVYIRDPLTYTQASSSVYNKAEQFVAFLHLEDLTRIRAVVNNNLHANSYNCAVRVRINVGTL